MKAFEDLEAYKVAFEFTIQVFKLTEKTKINYNIANQLERAALSIPNNISEGFELQSNKQFIKFLYITKSSCGECRNLLAITNRLEQINKDDYISLKNQCIDISKQLSNFIKYLNKSEIY